MPEQSIGILIVDDEALVRWSLESTFNKLGYRTVVENSGFGAINLLMSNQFNLVITDLELPDYDGVQVAQAAKKYNPDIFVIMISARSKAECYEKLKEAPVDYFFSKPFNLDEIMELVGKLIFRSQ